ncbi:MAG: carboxymuconolactone decarboxylase family protein [Solirubrobacteraceae bacterium]
MARVPSPDPTAADVEPLVERIVSERGSLLELYHVLLHAPPVAAGWLEYLTSIRGASSLPGRIRELVIMRIAHVNRAPYEAREHAPIARREGLSAEQIEAITDWHDSPLFDSRARAALAYADAMTSAIQVPEDIFNSMRAEFDTRQVVELTATIAAYNMVSRFLEALEIRPHDAER